MQGYTLPFRCDCTINGGGRLLYIREDIPSRVLNMFDNDLEFETILVRFHRVKWFLSLLSPAQKEYRIKKVLPRLLHRDYKRYNNLSLRDVLVSCFTWGEIKMMSNDHFTAIFMKFLNMFEALKQRNVRTNENTFITKN